MQNTLEIFQDRKAEIELYYSVIIDIDQESPDIKTINNTMFLKILKSNYILMLYNLVEACTVNGILEIYESIKNDSCSYFDVIEEIQNIWIKYQVSQIYGPTTAEVAYQNRVKEVLGKITQKTPLQLTKEVLRISGNLDARKIKGICDSYRIRYKASDKDGILMQVKNKRNDLAHGFVSFSDCARDLTISDLENIKDTIFNFMQGILSGMKKYYDKKEYLTLKVRKKQTRKT